MLGMSRNDATQQAVAVKYREGFMPYRDGFVVKVSRHADPICITSDQREQLVEAYSIAYARAMRIVMVLVLVGIGGWVTAAAVWDVPLSEWGFILLFLAVGTITYTMVRRAIRDTVAGFGPRPLALPEDYAEWQRQRLRDRPWSSILAPLLVVPVILLRWHVHLPPRDADGYLAALIMIGFAVLVVWITIRKLQAERG